MKKDLGRKIRQLMVESGIKTAKQLADRINEEAGEKIVTPTSVGRWLAGRSVPKATSLMFLAKALNVTADLILFDDSESPDKKGELRRLVTAIVQEETKKVLIEKKTELQKELIKFISSEKIPKEDKESLLRQIKNLLRMYEEI